MPVRVLFTSVTVRPPMTAVSPSFTRSWLSVFCLSNDEAEVRRRERLDRRPLGVELHQDLAVVGHVRRDGEPDTGLLELHVGAGGRRAAAGRAASTTRTGISSPTRMSACRLSSVVMTGSAWMSASSTRSSALQERGEREAADARSRRPGRAPSAVMLASALPMAETLLPPRSTTLTFRSNGSPGRRDRCAAPAC